LSKSIEINTDIGEGYGEYKVANDEELMNFVSSVNVACGFHAGDPMIMNNIVNLANQNNVKVGAHPSYDDFRGFGRRKMDLNDLEITNDTLYQLGALKSFTSFYDIPLSHVSPHGELGHACIHNKNTALAFIEAVVKFDEKLEIYTQKGELYEIAKKKGLNVKKQIFADRTYNDDGTLTSRKKEGSVINELEGIMKQCIDMILDKTVTSINGKTINIEGEILVVHSDTPGSEKISKKLLEGLKGKGIDVLNK